MDGRRVKANAMDGHDPYPCRRRLRYNCTPRMSVLRINTDIRTIIAVNAQAFLMGTVLLFLLSRIRLLFSVPVLLFMITALVVALALDVLVWFFNGIRTAQVDSHGLILERGRARDLLIIRREQILNVRVRRLLGKSLLLAVQPMKRKIVPLKSAAPRVRISDAGFPKADFDRLVAEVVKLSPIS
jgi:hypothetical protein